MVYRKIAEFCKKNYLMLACAIMVGTVSVLPHFLAVRALGDEYQGIPFIYQANEDAYLARIQEVVDGHGNVGSAFFYEYKDWKPLVPSTGEYIYALPTLLFSIPLLSVMSASKFVLPALLFILIYYLIVRLSTDPTSSSARVNAIVGGLLVTLGYDLIDYRSVMKLIEDPTSTTILSVWIRPINPITGAILIFSFLLLAWSMVTKRSKYIFVPAGAVWALTIGYVFSWTFVLVFVGLLILFYSYKKDWYLVRKFLLTVLVWLILTLPYWYTVVNSFTSPNGKVAATKSGMVFTHAPICNKLLLAGTFIFIACSLYFRYAKKEKFKDVLWWWFCAGLLLTSWIVFNQQVITGRSIWYHHYVQYTIPALIVVGMVLLNNWIKPALSKVWLLSVVMIIGFVSIYNILGLRTVANYQADFKKLQDFAPVFNWINNNTDTDCVVLNQDAPNVKLDTLIPAFTHCNVYTPSWVFDGVPDERVWHNYLVILRLRNVEPANIKAYLEEHKTEVLSYFFVDWDQLFYGTGEGYTQKKIEELTIAYQEFVKKDFREELKKYKLDYILFVGEPGKVVIDQLSGISPVFNSGEYFMYQF